MNPITRECQDCQDLQEVLSNIDCTLLDITKNKYNSIVYGVEECCSSHLHLSLLNYRRIVEARTYNPHYPCYLYSSNEILSKVRLLTYKTNCSRCPECEEVITTTTTLPTPGVPCTTYLIAPNPLTEIDPPESYPYSYIDCEGGLVTGILTQYQVLNICAMQGSVSINPVIFSVTEYNDEECDIEPEDCICAVITNEETDPGVVPYEFSYEDCNGNTFTDIALDYQDSMNICVRRSTLEANFAYSLLNNGACIEDCPTTTTTTTP